MLDLIVVAEDIEVPEFVTRCWHSSPLETPREATLSFETTVSESLLIDSGELMISYFTKRGNMLGKRSERWSPLICPD